MTDSAEIFDTLCAVLDADLERQENLLAVCEAQGQAIRTQQLSDLVTANESLNLISEEIRAAAGPRKTAMRGAFTAAGQPREDDLHLGALVNCLPEPWKTRTAYYRKQLDQTASTVRRTNMLNMRLLKRCQRAADDSLAALVTAVRDFAPESYTTQGDECRAEAAGPALVDTKG